MPSYGKGDPILKAIPYGPHSCLLHWQFDQLQGTQGCHLQPLHGEDGHFWRSTANLWGKSWHYVVHCSHQAEFWTEKGSLLPCVRHQQSISGLWWCAHSEILPSLAGKQNGRNWKLHQTKSGPSCVCSYCVFSDPEVVFLYQNCLLFSWENGKPGLDKKTS